MAATCSSTGPNTSNPRHSSYPIPVISLQEWETNYQNAVTNDDHDDNNNNNNNSMALLDVRPHGGWIASALVEDRAIAHIPLSELRERSFELPPRHVPFGIILSNTEDETSRQAVLELLLGQKERKRQLPWNVKYVIDASSSSSSNSSNHCREWTDYPICQTQREGTGAPPPMGVAMDSRLAFRPLPRLWEPDSMIERILLPLLREQLFPTNNSHAATDNNAMTTPPLYQIWDLGAGAGRDACFLAEQLQYEHIAIQRRPSFRVVAVDQRYQQRQQQQQQNPWEAKVAARQTIQDFFHRRGVVNVTEIQAIQLNDIDRAIAIIRQQHRSPDSKIGCFYAVRYWNRPLIERLVHDDDGDTQPLLADGTIVAISHFGLPHTDAVWVHEHPNVKHVLQRDELSTLFHQAGWHILLDQVVSDTDHGRTLIQFVAQKKKSI